MMPLPADLEAPLQSDAWLKQQPLIAAALADFEANFIVRVSDRLHLALKAQSGR